MTARSIALANPIGWDCTRFQISLQPWRSLIRGSACGTVLRAFYAWYRKTAPMPEKIQRDRGAVPALDALMQRTSDARLSQLSDALAAGFGKGGRRASRTLIRLALDFWTWRRLSAEGLSDKMAADLMTNAIVAAFPGLDV